ncbi:nucleotidyltransferase domain-containing protein [Metabacillus bambusae]|uniref:Nucleotidyltransferase domain-containing protein n=1 Tax=Metabacillus bambusae TaxID=2795218 RepID=A0ABS3N402_9BACI|nr:nucleotidyltransferase domain-containing protein [Metabacillus bambusae]MBO1512618.1 nucleotidyltransferase domain-containing protein [Metabacillus bambusae]
MEFAIKELLKTLEKQENITILFACESGSRAWGTSSHSSDYDVRFIYIRELDWYLQLFEGRDVIEISPNDKVEMVGWDLKKALKLLQKSNPTLLEWIYSPIIYLSETAFTSKLKTLSQLAFSSIPTVHHYLNMAKKNYQTLLKEKRSTTKRYLNILRPLLTCLWILDNQEMPKIDITSLSHQYINDPKLNQQFDLLLQSKQNGQQYFESMQLNIYCEETIQVVEEMIKNVQNVSLMPTNTLNEFFLEIVKNVSP